MAARRRGDEEWNTGVQKTCQALETDVAEKNGTMYRVQERPLGRGSRSPSRPDGRALGRDTCVAGQRGGEGRGDGVR
jgi:hypothetical protein